MKKFVKKPLAITLALLIILSSLTVAVYGLSLDDSGTFTLYTHFSRLKDDGTWEGVDYDGENTCDGTLYVKKGDTIKATMDVESVFDNDYDPFDGEDTEFNVYQFALLLSYDESLLTLQTPGIPQLGNAISFSSGSLLGTCTLQQGIKMATTLGLDTTDTQFVYFYTNFIRPYGEVLDPETNGKDVVEFTFTVDEDASYSKTSLFTIVEASILPYMGDVAVTPSYVSSYDSFDKIDSDQYFLNLVGKSEMISLEGRVNFDLCEKANGFVTDASKDIRDNGDGTFTFVGENGTAIGTVPNIVQDDDQSSKYVFQGWATEPDATEVIANAELYATLYDGKDPVTYYAVYAPHPYDAIYKADTDGDGELNTVDTVEYGYGESVVPHEDAVRPGYAFNGWDNEPVLMPNSDVTVTGTFSALPQTITYFVDGVEAEDLATTADTDSEYTLAAEPTKAGYTFSGWTVTDENEAVVSINDGVITVPVGGATVSGTFSPDDQTITYYVDDAYYASEVYKTDEEITAIDEPTKAGYEFSGWSEIPATMPAGGVEINGVFTALPQEVTYSVSGEVPASYTAPVVAEADRPVTDSEYTLLAAPTVDGYTFAGWSVTDSEGNTVTIADGKVIVPAGGIAVAGTFTADEQPVIYKVDGVEDGERSTEAKTDSFHTLASEPTKAGYAFSGWAVADTAAEADGTYKVPAGGLVIEGTFTAVPQEIKYTVDGVEAEDLADAANTDSEYTLASEPTKAGYTFGGWAVTDSEGNVVTITDGKIIVPAGGVTAAGIFTADEQTLTVDVNGTETTEKHNTDEKFSIAAPAESVKPGYEFTGWVVIDSEGNTVEADENGEYIMPPTSAAATAQFAPLPQDIIYIVDGVEDEARADIAYTDTFHTLFSEPTKPGYEFSGWSVTGAEAETDGTYRVPAGGLVIEGTFTALPQNIAYSVTGDVPAGYTAPTGITALTDSDYTLEAAPEIEGYTFGGWVVEGAEANADGTYTVPAGGLTITGNFTVNTYVLTLKLNNGEEDIVDEAKVYGTAIILPENVEKTGYTFTGWVDDNEVEFTDAYGTMPARDLTFNAQYDINSYTITYYADQNGDGVDELINTQTYDYNADVTALQEPAREGYSFEWQDVPATMPAEDVEVYGVYTINTYYFRVFLDEEEVDTIPLEYNTEFTDEILMNVYIPDIEGYMFTDFIGEIPATMPAHDVAIYLIYEPIEYWVSYYADFNGNGTFEYDEYIEYQTYYMNDTIDPLEDPEKAGYSFDGWRGIPEIMPAEDIDVYGTFTALPQEVTYAVNGDVPDGYTAPVVAEAQWPDTDSEYTLEAAPEITGYTFGGWVVTDSEGNELTVTDGSVTVPAGGITVTGTFEINSYNATFDPANTDTPYVASVVYGGSVTSEVPTELYNGELVFAGWKYGDTVYSLNGEIKGTEDIATFVMPAEVVVFTAQWRPAVFPKLMPADGAMSTMIERATVVETADEVRANTWKTAGRRQTLYAPNGVTNVMVADDESYNYKTAAEGETYETYFVYGLAANLKDTDLANYVKVSADGTYEVTNTGRRGEVKTGTIITVYDKDGTFVERFYVVIYGDVNADGKINASDATALDNEIESRDWSINASVNYTPYIIRAANLDRNTSISASDSVSVKSLVEGAGSIDQTAGYYVAG